MPFTDLEFARSQMALSLAFHIVFAVVGIGMPLLMVIAEGLYLRTGRLVYLDLTKRWAKGTAILFAVGAVSGTVLSFELGLLWPTFMEHAGPIIGMPFSLEGFAFFTEAIFLGLFLYGWNRVPPLAHWLSGVMVALSGAVSGIFVVTANAWMNAPTGFTFVDGQFTGIDPVAAMLNPASLHQVLHMTLAAYVATGFGVTGIHAFFLLRKPDSAFHRAAFVLSAALGCVAIPLQIASGDLAARRVAELQPAKLAAMEAHYHTGPRAPFVIGGVPDSDTQTVRGAIEIPAALSILVGGSPDAVVTGLDQFPRDQWPNVKLVHWSFDIMVACGIAMLALAGWAGVAAWKARRSGAPPGRALLRAFVWATPLGFIAVETGWFVTELGRQPWIIYGYMRTVDALTPMPGLVVPFAAVTLVYLVLSVVVVLLMKRQFLEAPDAPLRR
ncbi:MAG TPA: cytochrome ubiquinol oxidase subunit I [Acidobacteriota bacterium]|nr:cytochrome ubiquinol oxidase subunit I [Acidobacteriota bacterium]